MTVLPEPDALLEEALDWVVRLKAGEPTRADVDALMRWRRQSIAHEEAFKKAAGLLRNAGIAARELADQTDVAPALPPFAPTVLARRAFLGGAIAAAAGYLVVRPPLGLWPSLQELSADYRTVKGEQRKVVVSPGISIELNTQTSITLRSVPTETRIELISGEASVAATLSSSRQFVILAADGRVTAFRADFNARCLDGSVSVTCVDGTVNVEYGRQAVRLQKAEQVSYSSAGLEPSVSVDAAQVTSWQTGSLTFRDKPLASVVDEINRYRSGRIIITSPDLKQRVVNGTFQIDRLENFVPQVEQLFGARVRSLPGGVVLLS